METAWNHTPGWRAVAPALLGLALLVIACQDGSAPPSRRSTTDPDPSTPHQAVEVPIILLTERFESPLAPADHIDGIAFWSGGPDHWWVVATAKEANRLNIYDARSGQLLRTAGRTGAGRGELRRPHDLTTVDDLLLVCERDNARVQVFSLPSLESLGWFGSDQLEHPYGLAAYRPLGGSAYEVFVGDNYASSTGVLDLSRRVKRFRLRIQGDGLTAEHVDSFGETEGEGALLRIETLTLDPSLERLLIAEATGGEVKVYTLDGEFEDAVAGRRKLLPEALATVSCPNGGYLITSEDEFSVSVFEVFDRQTLERMGVFGGSRTRNSDGLVVVPTPFPNFPQGAVFASNNDQSVVAFSWGEIVSALGLPSECIRSSGTASLPSG